MRTADPEDPLLPAYARRIAQMLAFAASTRDAAAVDATQVPELGEVDLVCWLVVFVFQYIQRCFSTT